MIALDFSKMKKSSLIINFFFVVQDHIGLILISIIHVFWRVLFFFSPLENLGFGGISWQSNGWLVVFFLQVYSMSILLDCILDWSTDVQLYFFNHFMVKVFPK